MAIGENVVFNSKEIAPFGSTKKITESTAYSKGDLALAFHNQHESTASEGSHNYTLKYCGKAIIRVDAKVGQEINIKGKTFKLGNLKSGTPIDLNVYEDQVKMEEGFKTALGKKFSNASTSGSGLDVKSSPSEI